MNINNLQDLNAPGQGSEPIIPAPQKQGKMVLIGAVLFLVIVALGWMFSSKLWKEGPLLKNRFLTYTECVEKTQLPCKFNFVGDFGHEWTPSPWRSEQECLNALPQVGRTCLTPAGNFKEVRWVGSGDVAQAEMEQSSISEKWQTYTSSEDGYSISYPPSYHVAYEHNIINFDETKYEVGMPLNGVKIQINKRDTTEIGLEKEISKLNTYIVEGQINIDGGIETKIISKTLGEFDYYKKVLSGPGGSFEVYYAPGKTSRTYFLASVWRSEQDPEVVSKILSSFKVIDNIAPLTQ